MGGDFQLAWDVLLPLIMLGVTIGVTFAVISGFVKLGWKFAPYIIVGAFLVWFFS
jgi:prepilin signal peptidase PulO-like enzyme (type II secretory pathway)